MAVSSKEVCVDVLDSYSQLIDREISLCVFRTIKKLQEVDSKSLIGGHLYQRDAIFSAMIISQKFSSVDDIQVFLHEWPQCRRWVEGIIKDHDENYLLSLLWTVQHVVHLQ